MLLISNISLYRVGTSSSRNAGIASPSLLPHALSSRNSPLSIRATTTHTTKTTVAWLGFSCSLRARSRARFYGRLIRSHPGRIFDVGTGDCRHFDELRRFLDLECAGIEIQPDVAAKGRARGYDVLEGTLETADLTDHVGRYDIVSMNHILEHVVHPHIMLERTFDLLRPGGHVIGQLPTVTSWENKVFGHNWGGYHYPRHLQIPSKVGLSGLLEDVGFSSVKIRSAPHIQTTISLQNTLVRRGWRPPMHNGKTPAYGALLLAALPYETVAWVCDEGGIVNFQAQKNRS